MRLNVKPLKKSWNAFLTISWKTFVQLQAVELGDQQKGFLEISKEILGESTDWKSWKLRIRTIPPNPPFFCGGVVPFQPAFVTTMTLYDLNVFFFPTSSGGIWFPSPGRVTLTSAFPCVSHGKATTSFQAKAGGLGVDLGRFLGFGNPWQALLARMACPRNLGKKNPLRLQICPQTDFW